MELNNEMSSRPENRMLTWLWLHVAQVGPVTQIGENVWSQVPPTDADGAGSLGLLFSGG